jgi:FKBP-type peptidyl-prolyl cis-trans isomerase (trigger factor)
MKGFRKGKAPKEFAESSVMVQAQQSALEELLPKYAIEIMKQEDIQPAAPLSYEIESVDLSKGAKIKAIISVVPEFKLPDLKGIKSKVKKQSTSVSDKEVNDVIKHLWEEHRGKSKNKDDKWAKSVSKKIGIESENMKDFESQLKDSIKNEKERLVAQKYSSDLLAKTIETAKVEVPEAMIHMETHAREDSFSKQMEQMKMSADQFCKMRGVTMDQLKEQWEKDSKEALLSDIFLSKYAQEKGLKVEADDLKAEIEIIKSRSPNADSKVFDNPQWKKYIERVLLKRKAHQAFLEEIDPDFFKSK